MSQAVYWPLFLPVSLLPVLLRIAWVRRGSKRFAVITPAIALGVFLISYLSCLFLFYFRVYEKYLACPPSAFCNSAYIVPMDSAERLITLELPTVWELCLRDIVPLFESKGCFTSNMGACWLADLTLTDEVLGGTGWFMLSETFFMWALISTLLGLGAHELIDHLRNHISEFDPSGSQ